VSPEERPVFEVNEKGELEQHYRGRVVKRKINCNSFKEHVQKKYGLYVPDRVIYAVCAHYNAGNNMLFAGDPGTGKTMMIKALADYIGVLGDEKKGEYNGYFRVQMYPGITYVDFIGDWDYPRQLIAIQAIRTDIDVSPRNVDEMLKAVDEIVKRLHDPERYFRKGPAVRALEKGITGSILHIDELNRGSEESQALLFEITGEKQVTHPSGISFRTTDRYTPDGKEADFITEFPQFPVIIATINEGDVATVELSSALMRRFERVVFERPPVPVQLQVLERRISPDVLKRADEVVKSVL